MKILFVTFLSLVLSFNLVSGQDCSKFYPMKDGSTMEYTSYNRKDKVVGIVTYVVSEVTSSGNKTTATMNMEHEDPNGDIILESDFKFSCENNVVKIDFSSLMNNKMLEAYEGMEVEMTGNDIELPNDLTVGQTLPDANVHVKISTGAMDMNMNIDMVNRKVETKESLSTDAGTFNCYVITNENKSKMMMANTTHISKLWLAEGIGMIKQETYNKNGKMISKVVLTSYSE